MIDHSKAYDEAIVADSRKQLVRAVFDLSSPDMEIGDIVANDESNLSRTAQVVDRGTDVSPDKIATLELNRWVLDGSFTIAPDTAEERRGQVGWESATLSREGRKFSNPYPCLEIGVSNITILQAMTFQFSEQDEDGFPTVFVLEVLSGNSVVFRKAVADNRSASVVIDGFTVNYPTMARLTIRAWSLPNRRVRVLRMLFGLYEAWDTKVLQSVDILTEVTFSGLRIPYSTCNITVENKNHRFDPYAPNAILSSIEERQKIVVDIGLRLPDGSTEWLPGGTFFQQSAGWKLNELTVDWSLLDIVGMLTKRNFVVPDSMPETLSGWVEAIMASLGKNFRTNYIVDEDVADIALTADADSVTGKKCGEMLRFLCMATNTWPRQDFATGFLRVGKIPSAEGNRITLDNMNSYPTMEANDDIADITFKLDGNGSVTFAGNNSESETSLSVDNPFIHTEDDARQAVISCMFEYGGKSFEVKSRGNPSSECGDIQSLDTQFNSTISARLYRQQISMQNGVMSGCTSKLVQSPNDCMYQNKELLTDSGTWVSPVAGTIKATLIGGGNGGDGGDGGRMERDGSDSPGTPGGGIGGSGGRVTIVEFAVTEGQELGYACGAAGAGGAGGREGYYGASGTEGEATTFGVLSSANGKTYETGIMDIQSGAVYGQKGADYGRKIKGSLGSGGAGGKPGKNGKYGKAQNKDTGEIYTYIAVDPTPGTAGKDGQPGCIILEW